MPKKNKKSKYTDVFESLWKTIDKPRSSGRKEQAFKVFCKLIPFVQYYGDPVNWDGDIENVDGAGNGFHNQIKNEDVGCLVAGRSDFGGEKARNFLIEHGVEF